MDAPNHAPPMKGDNTNQEVPRSGDSAYNIQEFNNKLDVEYNLPITSNRNAKWCVREPRNFHAHIVFWTCCLTRSISYWQLLESLSCPTPHSRAMPRIADFALLCTGGIPLSTMSQPLSEPECSGCLLPCHSFCGLVAWLYWCCPG